MLAGAPSPKMEDAPRPHVQRHFGASAAASTTTTSQGMLSPKVPGSELTPKSQLGDSPKAKMIKLNRQNLSSKSSSNFGYPSRVDAGMQCDPSPSCNCEKLQKERDDIKDRLEFVEELVGPTEAQRKILQDQVLASRAAALRAKHRGAGVPTRVMGRLDERQLWTKGLSDRDVGLLQGGCLPNDEGILQDVSLLGDPNFRPYNQSTGAPRWEARGGALQLSLADVRDRFSEDVAMEVVRCAKELDDHDPSRRVGMELPWHPVEDRELHPAEIIDILDREASLEASFAEECLQGMRSINAIELHPPRRHHQMAHSLADDYDYHMQLGPSIIPVPFPSPRQPVPGQPQQMPGRLGDDFASPYAAVIAPPRRARSRRPPRGRAGPRSARGGANGASEANNVVPLPRVQQAGPRTQDARCLMPNPPRLRMPADMMGTQVYTGPCADRLYHVY